MRIRAASGGGTRLNVAVTLGVLAVVVWWFLAAQYLPGTVLQSDAAAARSTVGKGLPRGSTIAATVHFLQSSSMQAFVASHDFGSLKPDTAYAVVPVPDDVQPGGQLCRSEKYPQGTTLFAAARGTMHTLGLSSSKQLDICFYYDGHDTLQRVAVYEHSG
jgi:hypothetical protein